MAEPVFRVPTGIKLSKSDRKTLKKHLRSQHTLFRHEKLNLSDEVSQHIVVGNGGLGNNVRREELVNIFSKYGSVVDVLLKPRKPYAFVTFSTVQESVRAFQDIHGRTMKCPEELSLPNVTFYLSFVKEVPGFELSTSYLHPPGLILLEDMVSESYEHKLLECVKWENSEAETSEESANSQILKHRRVKHYGYEFIYGINNVDRDKPLNEGIPITCEELLTELVNSHHISCRPDQLTVNQYLPGQGIPPHIDTHSAFEDWIISLSLGSQVIMDFRHPDGRHLPVLVPQRSVLIMTGESRYVWTHGITPRKSDVVPVNALAQQQPRLNADGDRSESADNLADRLTMFQRNTRTSFTFRKVLRGPCKCKYPEQCDSKQKSSSKDVSNSQTKENKSSLPDTDKEAAMLEKLHVHEVYEEIADHFSDTRHKAWPKVAEFIRLQTPGSVMIDAGCGNGKYLGINPDIYKIGCDRSTRLCHICKDQNFEVLVSDILALPYRDNCCDVAISIAVIHHLSTWDRRVRALEEIVRILRPGGKALISVWAFEQELCKQKSNYLKESRIRNKHSQKKDGSVNTHRDDSLQEDMSGSCLEQRANSLEVHVNRTHFDKQDLLVPWHKKPTSSDEKCGTGEEMSTKGNHSKPVFHRFYHVFKDGELNELVQHIPGARVTEAYYDKGNWCVILEKVLES